jgi:hypothetical protein
LGFLVPSKIRCFDPSLILLLVLVGLRRTTKISELLTKQRRVNEAQEWTSLYLDDFVCSLHYGKLRLSRRLEECSIRHILFISYKNTYLWKFYRVINKSLPKEIEESLLE